MSITKMKIITISQSKSMPGSWEVTGPGGEIRVNAASFALYDERVQIATLAVCLHSKTSGRMWAWLHEHAPTPLPDNGAPPPPAWAALRYDVAEVALPPWIDWWAKHVGYALMTREGW